MRKDIARSATSNASAGKTRPAARRPDPNKDHALIGTADPVLVGRASLVPGAAEEFTPTSTA